MRIFLFLLSLFLTTSLVGQEVFTLSGHVSDSETGEPLSGVNIFINETMRGTTTDNDGNFKILINKLPSLIVFSRVGYTRQYFNLTSQPSSAFNVPMQKSINEIPEVEITAKRTAIKITARQDLYVVDYDFYDEHILLLGHPSKKSRKVNLLLMDRSGKPLIRKEVRGGVNLFHDPFNNIHLLASDTAYQLFFDGKDIKLLYPSDKNSFLKAFPEFLKVYNDKVILRQFAFEDQSLMYYFYNPADSSIQRIWAQATAEVYRKLMVGWVAFVLPQVEKVQRILIFSILMSASSKWHSTLQSFVRSKSFMTLFTSLILTTV
ncbi:MAG: carboxypeptidase-like regulatory domain-containing protein [Bacteroidales bacterium]|nr:carboxypeptidase-like regulatory domain-containing protein [Bacteroidales bacterium]